MEVLITGANGQLGKAIKEISSRHTTYTYFFADRMAVDISNYKQTQHFVVKNNIKVIINCAAYTNVEQAEDDFDTANLINHLSVKNLAEISKDNNIHFIHVSTDYVFDGSNENPYKETDISKPINVYGKTKRLGEEALLKINPERAIIIRTSWLYSRFNANFLKTMLLLGATKEKINVIDNQIGSPTNASDLAEVILSVAPKLNNKNTAIYHYSNKGQCSWFHFAKEIMLLAESPCIVEPINSKEYPTKAKRPKYSLLDTSKIQRDFNLTIPSWKESLKTSIIKLRK